MTNVQVNISVNEAYVDRISEVVQQCREAGLNVEQVFDAVGIITGSIDSAKLAQLQTVRGIEGVETDRTFTIAPPDSDVQ